MSQETLAFKTLVGKKINLTSEFELACEIDEDTKCGLNIAHEIVYVAKTLNKRIGPTIARNDLTSWGYHGIPEIAKKEMKKVKAEFAAEKAAIRERNLVKNLKSIVKTLGSLSK